MTVKNLTPDSKILHQVEGEWQKLFMLVVWKLAKQGVIITHDEMSRCMAEYAPQGGPALLTHGHHDSIEFRVLSQKEAEQLAKLHGPAAGTV